jgi:hypothetical protein
VIVVWSELSEPIGAKLSLLADADYPDELAATLAAESGDEALAAWRVLQALQNGPVFLRSLLDPDEVEPLGVAPIANLQELQRLVSRFEACTVLEEAQHVRFAELFTSGGEPRQ